MSTGERPARTFGGQLLRLGAHVAGGLAALAVVLTLGAWWLHASYQRGGADSAFVAALEKLDREGEPAALYAALREGLRKAAPRDAELTLFWLEGRRHRGDLPTLHFMAAYAEETGWRDRALEFLAAARLTAEVDALACPEGRAVIARVERELGLAPAVALIAGDAEARPRAIRFALDYEEANRPRPVPVWLCGAGGAAPASEAARVQARAAFGRDFAAR